MAYHTFDDDRIAKDLLIVFRCEEFNDVRPIEALRQLKRARGETRV